MREQNGRVLSRTAVHFVCNPHLHSVFTLKIPHLSFRDILKTLYLDFIVQKPIKYMHGI